MATYRESRFVASSGSTSMPKSLKASINSSKSTLPVRKKIDNYVQTIIMQFFGTQTIFVFIQM